MRKYFLLVHLLPLLSVFPVVAAVDTAAFIGTWEYRQGAGDGYDDEGERLELNAAENKIRGLYYGLEREGEHGLFYTLVEIKNARVSPDGYLAFMVPKRKLFARRPKSLNQLKTKEITATGMIRTELKMEGRLEGGNLIVHCTSINDGCPEDRMVFKRGYWR